MKKSRLLPIAFLLAAGVVMERPASAVTLVHTNDVLGELEPCGCRTNPLGGMVRKANLLKCAQDPEMIQVDAGDLLFPSDSMPDLLKAQAELQAGYLLRSMDMIHQDAAVPGEKDFALGFRVFEKLRKATKTRFIAANLSLRKGGSYLPKHLVIEKKGTDGKPIRVGIFGLVGEKLAWPKELHTSAAIAAAKAEVQALRHLKADYIIALTHQGLDRDQELAKKVPGIYAIIGGHTQSFLQNPMQVGSTWIFQSSFRNQYVGLIPLMRSFDPETYRLVGLDAGYDSPANALTPMDALVKEFKEKVAALNSEEQSNLQARSEAELKSDEKFQTFPHCAECHAKQFEFWRKTKHANALHALLDKQQIRNKECLMCHTLGLGDSLGFSDINKVAEHAGGFLPLEDLAVYLERLHKAGSLKGSVKLSQSAPETTLQESLGKFTKVWAPVQCENCHQPGAGHPFSGTYAKTVEKTTCLGCHTPDRAPEWYTKSGQPDWEKINDKRAQVTCPAGSTDESAND